MHKQETTDNSQRDFERSSEKKELLTEVASLINRKRELWQQRATIQKDIQRKQQEAKAITREIRGIDEAILSTDFEKEVSHG